MLVGSRFEDETRWNEGQTGLGRGRRWKQAIVTSFGLTTTGSKVDANMWVQSRFEDDMGKGGIRSHKGTQGRRAIHEQQALAATVRPEQRGRRVRGHEEEGEGTGWRDLYVPSRSCRYSASCLRACLSSVGLPSSSSLARRPSHRHRHPTLGPANSAGEQGREYKSSRRAKDDKHPHSIGHS